MSSRDLARSASSFHAAIGACGACGRWAEAVELLAELGQRRLAKHLGRGPGPGREVWAGGCFVNVETHVET